MAIREGDCQAVGTCGRFPNLHFAKQTVGAYLSKAVHHTCAAKRKTSSAQQGRPHAQPQAAASTAILEVGWAGAALEGRP